jgi:hypothetical protein
MSRAAMTAGLLLIALGCSSAARQLHVLERETAQWTIPGDEGQPRSLDVVVLRVETGLPPESFMRRVEILLARDGETGLTYHGAGGYARGLDEMLRERARRFWLAEHDGRLYEFWWSDRLEVQEITQRTASMADAERHALQSLTELKPGPVPVEIKAGIHIPVKLKRSFTFTGSASDSPIIFRDGVFRDGAWRVTVEGAKKQRAVISFTEKYEVLGILYEEDGERKQEP